MFSEAGTITSKASLRKAKGILTCGEPTEYNFSGQAFPKKT
jgi:hypothetical protein